MANGFAPYLLQDLANMLGQNDPSIKITPPGFLRMAWEKRPQYNLPQHQLLQIQEDLGNIRELRVKYLQPSKKGQSRQFRDCSIDTVNVYNEATIDASKVRQTSIYLPNATVRQYEAQASQVINLSTGATNGPRTAVMKQVVTEIMAALRGFIADINEDLYSAVTWGTNETTGNNSARTVNFPLNPTTYNLQSGIGQILADMQQNEVFGNPNIVGGGLFAVFQQQLQATGINQSGIDNSLFNNTYNYYFDPDVNGGGAWGSNNIGIFADGTIGIVDLNEYVGSYAYERGDSVYCAIQLPFQTSQDLGQVRIINFDVQLRWINCPQVVTKNGYSGDYTVSEGLEIIITKQFGLFQQPSDAYASGDRLDGVNGAFRYAVTNS